MPLSSLEEESYSLDGTLGSLRREPGLSLLRLGDCAPDTTLASPSHQLDAEGEVRDTHSHPLEERNIVRVAALLSPRDEHGQGQDLVPATGRVAGHEFTRKLLHAREIVDRHPGGAVEDVLRELLPIGRNGAHRVEMRAALQHAG